MSKRRCIYGNECYRNNPAHLEEFEHPEQSRKQNNKNEDTNCVHVKITNDLIKNTYGFFLNKIPNYPRQVNHIYTISLKELLDESNGKLIQSIHFNYMFDIEWLISNYPEQFRNNPIYIVYGKHFNQIDDIKKEAKNYKQIKLCPAIIKDPYGTHHTKMMILQYETGLRIVIHTANMVSSDWTSKTQGFWVSPILSKTTEPSSCKTNFKDDLLEYLNEYKSASIKLWHNLLQEYDFSPINVYLIASVPGRHLNNKRSSFGHMKLRKILNNHEFGPSDECITWPIISQFSSIGFLGKNPTNWLESQFLSSLSSIQSLCLDKPELKCIFPTVENVRLSLDGYSAGRSLPYSNSVASKQPYLEKYFHQWKATISGRTEASPHIKTYCRLSPDGREISWFCLTSANLSKSAWGELQVKGSKLFIRSYELGVVFLPKLLINQNSFKIKNYDNQAFPLPYDTPLIPYDVTDKPWIWDLNYVEKTDRHGNVWCPT